MIDGGYFAKRIEARPDWLQAHGVSEVCSVSNCISTPPDGWIEHWRHNGFGWFNRIADATDIVPLEQRANFRLFAYRLHPLVFQKSSRTELAVPPDVRPEPIPATFRSLGFDSASKSMESILGFECSPLSCNSMAAEFAVNEFCLFASLQDATAGAERFAAEQPEPGDYYVIEVLEHRDAFAIAQGIR